MAGDKGPYDSDRINIDDMVPTDVDPSDDPSWRRFLDSYSITSTRGARQVPPCFVDPRAAHGGRVIGSVARLDAAANEVINESYQRAWRSLTGHLGCNPRYFG